LKIDTLLATHGNSSFEMRTCSQALSIHLDRISIVFSLYAGNGVLTRDEMLVCSCGTYRPIPIDQYCPTCGNTDQEIEERVTVFRPTAETLKRIADSAPVARSMSYDQTMLVREKYSESPSLDWGAPLGFDEVTSVDIAILTVLSEEHEEMFSALGTGNYLQGSVNEPNRYSWSRHQVRDDGNRLFSVVLGKTARPTTIVAQAAVQKTIAVWQPTFLIWVGVCGGIQDDADRLSLGDVIFSSQIFGYEYGKEGAHGFSARADFIYPISDTLLVNASTVGETWKSRLAHTPRLFFAPIASGNKVVDNDKSRLFQEIRRLSPRARGVEMEGAGAAHAIREVTEAGITVPFAMIRGVSDIPGEHAGTTVRDGWKRGASRASAQLTAALIRSRWPVVPRGDERSRDTPAADRLRKEDTQES